MMRSVVSRARAASRRLLADRLLRRTVRVAPRVPLISFTFDDAPASAFSTGAEIVEEHGGRATYFVSLGLLGSHTELGEIGSVADLERAVEQGHELGCHTYDHLDAWSVSTREFVSSVNRNRDALARLLHGRSFATFSYPKNGATIAVKSAVDGLFTCCRGGGQCGNIGTVDRNLVRAFFIAPFNGIDIAHMKRLIDVNAEQRGWLVFATHDIVDAPSRFGCTPALLDEIVAYAARSGAALLPMREAFDALDGGACPVANP